MSADTLRDKLAELLRKMGTPSPREREATHGRIDALLKRHKKSWTDVPDIMRSAHDDDEKPAAATAPSTPLGADTLRDKLAKLLRKMGTPFPHEREATHGRIDALLKRHKKDWPDLPDLLRSAHDDDDKPAAATAPSTPAPLDLICRLSEKYLYLTAAQRVALTLWIAHTYIFSRFSVTPRLALLSPVSHCGKSTVLNLIDVLGLSRARRRLPGFRPSRGRFLPLREYSSALREWNSGRHWRAAGPRPDGL
jgi:ElaB/YqjD/DUF883 family membrane-anchored ribosome-binding protein